MMGISEQYTKEIQQELKYSATWFPNIKMSPGDVGIFEDYQYRPKGNLNDFGIPFKVTKRGGQGEFDYSSKNSVSIHIKGAGEAPIPGSMIAKADAGISIKFNRENALVFRATNCQTKHLSNLNSIGKKIMDKYKKDEWDRNLILVSQVIEAEGSTILISHGGNSQIDLAAKGDIKAGNINLADINVRFKIINESNIASRFVAEPKLTPLFEGWGIKRKLILGTKFGPRLKGQAKNEERKAVKEQLDFKKVDYSDYIGVS